MCYILLYWMWPPEKSLLVCTIPLRASYTNDFTLGWQSDLRVGFRTDLGINMILLDEHSPTQPLPFVLVTFTVTISFTLLMRRYSFFDQTEEITGTRFHLLYPFDSLCPGWRDKDFVSGITGFGRSKTFCAYVPSNCTKNSSDHVDCRIKFRQN